MNTITREINFSTLIHFLIISIIAICLFVCICPCIYHLVKHGAFARSNAVALQHTLYFVKLLIKPINYNDLFSCLPLMLFSEHEFVSMQSKLQPSNGHYDVICVLLKITALLYWLSCPLSGFSVCPVLSHPLPSGAHWCSFSQTLIFIALLPKSRVSGVWHTRNITLVAVSSKYVCVNEERGKRSRGKMISARLWMLVCLATACCQLGTGDRYGTSRARATG